MLFRFKIIVEGANLFFTQNARLMLEEKGVIIFKVRFSCVSFVFLSFSPLSFPPLLLFSFIVSQATNSRINRIHPPTRAV